MSNYRLRLLRRDHIRAPSIWKLLSRRGYQVGVINVPMTYPAEEVNGFIVTGLGTPEAKSFTYPLELSPELLKRGYRVNKRFSYQPGQEAAYLQEIHFIAEKQSRPPMADANQPPGFIDDRLL
jgi:predicted AlkP superfamily phosphohydrolase/phosphomutase